MNKLGTKIVSILLIILGICSIGYGYYVYKNDFIRYENRVYTTGEIIEIKGFESTWDSTRRLAAIRYEVDGEEITSEIDYRSILFSNESTVNIYYDKEYPEMVSSSTSECLMIIFPILGVILIGMGVLLIRKKKKKRMKRA